MTECDFCNIINKELNAYVVNETDKSIAFLDMGPINEGHVLIVPKVHTSSIVNISDEVILDLTEQARKLVKFYEKEYGAKSYSVMQNGGECCDYGHFHLHVFPRYQGDGFGWTDGGEKDGYNEEVANKIRRAFM